jgi:hypothetical protein
MNRERKQADPLRGLQLGADAASSTGGCGSIARRVPRFEMETELNAAKIGCAPVFNIRNTSYRRFSYE